MADLAEQKYEVVAVGKLEPHPQNPRQGDVGAIADSIDANGFYGAVIAQRSTGRILAGKHRWDAARAQGLAKVPVIWLDVDDDRALRIILADNRTSDLAAYDDHALASLLAGLAEGESRLDGTAWTGDDLDALLADLGALDVTGDSARVPGLQPGDVPTTDGYREQYGVLVVCDGEAAQAEAYAALADLGYNCRVVTT